MTAAVNGKPRTSPAARPQPYVPERLLDALQLHVMRVLSGGPGPLMLGVHGAPGVGKTFGVQEALRVMEVRPFLISSGQLESAEAGRPAQLIRSAYFTAARAVAGQPGQPPRPAALVFNDVDVGLGDWGKDVQYTVNRQTAVGELMHLADFPGRVAGKPCHPVPVLLTGNDFGKLYRPLVRAGRMALLEWDLTPEERIDVLQGIFPELGYYDVVNVAAEFPGEPVVFFSELRRRCRDAALARAAADLPRAQAVRMAMGGGLGRGLDGAVTADRVIEAGRRLRREARLKDHLREGD